MSNNAHAVAPPVVTAAPPVQRKAEPISETQEAPHRLLTSLSSVPAVQRKCAGCAGEGNEDQMPVQPRLEVGPVDDPYEREADNIAGQVMAMREPAPASAAGATVQRACTACSGKSEEVQRAPADFSELTKDDDDTPRMRTAAGHGGEHIAASSSQLTSGGSSLAGPTRDFFENRMGRDLSAVRVHDGSDADALNQSISARAFTFQNHIWLSRAESEAPSETMAHELAHVLQQTQPGAVSPLVRRAPSKIISETLYFGEDRKKKGPPTHDLVVADAVKKNTKLMGEVAVPNAHRDRLVEDGFGYADLVLSDPNRLWGIRFAPYSGNQTPKPWYVVSDGGKNIVPKSLGYDARKQLHFDGVAVRKGQGYQTYKTKSHPRFGRTDYIRSAADAPSEYEIGDVKFAGDLDRKSEAEGQVGNYVTGFNNAARNFNKTVDQSTAVSNGTASGSWTGKSDLNPLARTSFSAKKMSTSAGSGNFIPLETGLKLRLSKFSKTLLGKDKYEPKTGFTYTGKSYYRQNSSNKFLWEYVFWPDAIKEQDNSASRANRRNKLTNASKTLYDQMVASPTGKKVMPLRAATHAALAPPRVQRAKPKKKLPPKMDPFQAQYSTWKAQQKSFTKTFSGYTKIKSGTGKEDVAKLAFDTAMQNTVKVLGGKAPGGTVPSLSTTALATAQKEFNQSELIEGRSGRMLGAMRKTFGATFVKALNIYNRLKTKFEAFLNGPKKKRSGGGKIGRTIIKVGGVIFGTIFKVMLPQIGAYLVECVEQGFKALMKGMMDVDFSKYTGEMETQITKKYEEIAAQIEAKVEAAAEAIKARFGAIYEAVMDKWEAAKTLVTIAKHVFNVARAAACAAGGLASVGISCLVAGVDYVLSLFNASPSEHLLSHMLSSCVAQKLIAEFVLGRAIIRNLPREIAETIRKNVKEMLPSEVKPLICDSITDTPDLPDVSEIPCEDINNPGGPNRGSDLSKPPPEFPPEMNKRRATPEEIKKYGRLGGKVLDDKGNLDRDNLPEELKKLLKPEAAPKPGTREVWDPPDSSSPPKAHEKDSEADKKSEAKPEKPKPETSDGTQGGGQGQSIRRGKLTDPTGQVSVFITILPGPSKGFSYGVKNGKTIYDVFIWVQTSELRTFGPLPMKIKVWEVRKQKDGAWIQFEADGEYVLSNQGKEIKINPEKMWGRLRKDK